jgi:hypothetical protein
VPQINKALLKMEKQGLVKGIKSVNFRSRKYWFDSNVTPSTEITGGFLFNDTDFNSDLLDRLQVHSKNYLRSNQASAKDLTKHLRQQVDSSLTEENVKKVLISLQT